MSGGLSGPDRLFQSLGRAPHLRAQVRVLPPRGGPGWRQAGNKHAREGLGSRHAGNRSHGAPSDLSAAGKEGGGTAVGSFPVLLTLTALALNLPAMGWFTSVSSNGSCEENPALTVTWAPCCYRLLLMGHKVAER